MKFVGFALTFGILSTAVFAADKPGACVIRPNLQSKAESSGIGVVTNAKSVCDANVEGCGSCVELCRLFTKITDKFGCPLDGADGFCNPDFPTDPDCDADQDGFFASDDCDDNDPFTFPGAPEMCFDEKDNGCTNGLVDEQDPACFPDGFCDGTRETFVNTDCIPETGICPGFNERIINDLEVSLGAGGVQLVLDRELRCFITKPSTEFSAVSILLATTIQGFIGGWRWATTIQNGQGVYLQSPNRYHSLRDALITETERQDCFGAA
jgi:hypothetical protein